MHHRDYGTIGLLVGLVQQVSKTSPFIREVLTCRLAEATRAKGIRIEEAEEQAVQEDNKFMIVSTISTTRRLRTFLT